MSLTWQMNRIDFSGANFSRTNLCEINFQPISSRGRYYLVAELTEVNFTEAELRFADLTKAILHRAVFTNGNLNGAKLEQADLREAKLNKAFLWRTELWKADLRFAEMTGACIDEWLINSATNLDDIVCDYVYLHLHLRAPSIPGVSIGSFESVYLQRSERRPYDPNRTFTTGEFTKRFQQVLDTVDLFFNDGIDWKAFLASLQELQTQYGQENLSIQGFEQKNGGFEVHLAVSPELDKGEIEYNAYQKYETQLQIVEAKYRAELHAKDTEIAIHIQKYADILELAKLAASRPITVEVEAKAVADNQSKNNTDNNTYNLSNAKFGGGFATGGGTQIGGTFNDYSQESADLDGIIELINTLRTLAQAFPQAQQEQVFEHLDNLQEDIAQPLEKRKISRIRAGLAALIITVTSVGGPIAATTDFANNVWQIADRMKIPREQIHPQSTPPAQPAPIDVKATKPEP